MKLIKEMIDHKHVAYTLLRLIVGINLFGHGFIRLPKIEGFREWMVNLFEKSPLPSSMISVFATVLPFMEFAVGIALIFGIFTRYAASLGALIICALIFGSCMIENWEMAGGQMVYGLMLFVLLFFSEYNKISADQLFFSHR